MKTVVSQAFKEQQKVDVDKSTVVVYGFSMEGQDRDEVLSMLDFLGCHCSFVRLTRIGLAGNHAKKSLGRPIKLQLKAPGDVNIILSNVKHLRDDAYYNGVRVSK